MNKGLENDKENNTKMIWWEKEIKEEDQTDQGKARSSFNTKVKGSSWDYIRVEGYNCKHKKKKNKLGYLGLGSSHYWSGGRSEWKVSNS